MLVDVPAAVLDEVRTANDKLEALLASIAPVHQVPAAVTRQARSEGKGLWGPIVRSDKAVTRVIPGPAGPVPLRVVVPDRDPDAVYLHIHGGGWTLGSAEEHDPLLEALAAQAGVAVVSADYRLAPEHPFPAGPDDCEAAAVWLLGAAASEFGTDRLLIGGESAGAHLSVSTLLRVRDRHDALDRFAGANLVFGAYDLSGTPSTRRWGERNLVLSTPIVEWFTENFLPGLSPEQRRRPDISPLYASLQGMPPALFTVGMLDPLLDDSLFMAARWEAAGSPATLRVYPEGPHAFHAFPTALGRMSVEEQTRFIADWAGGDH
ncbi:MAG TPA: alpha/beta hydrolase [Acidimicrobiales bacterium]|nr:alpha/beta hydrolase [Acidimicrobiales bacterium]